MAGAKREIEVLKKVPLFQGLSARHLKVVHGQSQEERFPAGKEIVRQGSTGGRFYVILEGRAKVIVGGKAKKTLGPGDFFGEMSLIDRGPRAATVQADTAVRTLSIAQWNFVSLLQEEWTMTSKVLLELVRRVRDMEKSVVH